MGRRGRRPLPWTAPCTSVRRSRCRGGGTAPPRALSRLRASCARVLARRRVRIALVCALVAVPLLGGGWLWFRKSSFVAVQTVHVIGAGGPQAHAIEAALRSAAHGMSTLDLDTAALRSAVAQFALVRGLHASPHFPAHAGDHAERAARPSPSWSSNGAHTAVGRRRPGAGGGGADGRPADGQRSLAAPARRSGARRRPCSPTSPCSAPPHAPWPPGWRACTPSSHGLTVAMRNGLLVYFGDAERAHAKWRALERVLLDEGSAGAGLRRRSRARTPGRRRLPRRRPAAGQLSQRRRSRHHHRPGQRSFGRRAGRRSAGERAQHLIGLSRGRQRTRGRRLGAVFRRHLLRLRHGRSAGRPEPRRSVRRQLLRRRRGGLGGSADHAHRSRGRRAEAQPLPAAKSQPQIESRTNTESRPTLEGCPVQRTLRSSQTSLTGRRSLHNVRTRGRARPLWCQTLYFP